jgi:ATP-dependent 26S proteasome regulatory subunit
MLSTEINSTLLNLEKDAQRKTHVISMWRGSEEEGKVQKLFSHPRSPKTGTSLIAGLGGVLTDILEMLALPLLHCEIFKESGIIPPRGLLIYGPAGCGKTLLANSIAKVCSQMVISSLR